MPTRTQISGTSQASIERYRQEEARFWEHYGLTAREHFVRIPSTGTNLRIQEVGEGEPVLFVHGTGGSGAYFAPLTAQLDGYRSLVLDRPGWGLSEPIDYTGRDYTHLAVELLEATLDDLDINRTHVAGGSIGNVWALRLAQCRPDRVRRIVWLGSTALEEFGVPRHIRLLASPIGRVMVHVGEKEKVMRQQLRDLIGHADSVESGAMDEFLRWRTVEAETIHFLRNERNMVQATLDKGEWKPGVTVTDTDLTKTTHPTLLVYGTNDPIETADAWRRTMNKMPHGDIEIIEGAGHLPWYDRPEQVGDTVRAFLTR